jgi:hypothetical protein
MIVYATLTETARAAIIQILALPKSPQTCSLELSLFAYDSQILGVVKSTAVITFTRIALDPQQNQHIQAQVLLNVATEACILLLPNLLPQN